MEKPFDLSKTTVGLRHDGSSTLNVDNTAGPLRVDGYTVGAPFMTRNAPHNGEMHPDGDELLYLISGQIDVLLEEGDTETIHALQPGQGFIVPKGVWHRVLIKEPSRLVHITPGPGGDVRPLDSV